MEVFITLLLTLIPLYIIILLGYFSKRYLNVNKEAIANLLIYIIVPVVVFYGVSKAEINAGTLSIPILFFTIPSLISLLFYYIMGIFWKDIARNILSLTAGSANIGYFGLPVAVAIFGNEAISIISLALVGMSPYHNFLGFFLAARGNHTSKESLLKIIKIPIIYAFILGLFVNLLGINLGKIFESTANNFTGAFTILGMLLIGAALGGCKKFVFDAKFITISIIASFFVWPLFMWGAIHIDQNTLMIFNDGLYQIFMLLSIVPVGANVVAYATILDNNPEKISLAVLVNTLFALFYIPLFVALFF
jgi:malate permease and related proteins